MGRGMANGITGESKVEGPRKSTPQQEFQMSTAGIPVPRFLATPKAYGGRWWGR